MGLIIGLLKRLVKLLIYFLIFAGIIVFIPNLPPYTKFTSIILEPQLPRTGPLAPNDALNNVEKAYTDKLLGPEVFQEYKGELYTSLATGEIVKISPGGHVTFVTQLGQPCSGLIEEHICGRPLDFVIDEDKGLLYVADAYQGIWKVDLKTDKKQLLVSPRVPINGHAPKFFNSLAVAKNGDIYWTDSSADFQLKDGAYTFLVDPSGRVLHYNAAKNESTVLLDNLWFANGVVLSPDQQFIIVAETARLRLLKYYVSGPNKGKSEVFLAGLPGHPDNVRVLPDGSGILVGLYNAFSADAPELTRSLAAAPLARKFLARLVRLLELPFEYLNTVYPHPALEEVVYYIGHFKSVSMFSPGGSGLLQVRWDGAAAASYYCTDGSIQHLSDAIVYNGRLYTGAPHKQNYIGSLPVPDSLKKAFQKKEQIKTEAPQKVEEKPKVKNVPTTTPKPEAPKTVKPVEAAKPVEKKAPKVEPKPTTPTPKTEPPKAQKQEAKPTPKPEVKTTPTPKAAPKTTPPPAKPDTKPATETKPAAKPEVKAKPAESKPQNPIKEDQKPTKPEIPIKEEIPSDTAKPTKETLKVIKKGGPTEIPNPNL